MDDMDLKNAGAVEVDRTARHLRIAVELELPIGLRARRAWRKQEGGNNERQESCIQPHRLPTWSP